MELLKHNEATLREVNHFVDNGKDCCVVNPCGSGKTSVMAAFIRMHITSMFLVITKQKNAAAYFIKKDPVFALNNVKIVTYSMMYRDYAEHRDPDKYMADYYLIDEAHYLGAQNWGKAFRSFAGVYSPRLIGLTATPQRFADQGTDHTVVDEFFGGNFAGNYTSSELQMSGVFTEPEYVLSIYNIEEIATQKLRLVGEADIPDDEKKKFEKKIRKIVDDWKKTSSPGVVMKERIPDYMYKENCNRILVYCACCDRIPEDMKFIGGILTELFPEKKISDYRYTYKDPESELSGFLAEDDSYIKVLYSVDKVMETIHIDDMKVMIALRPSVSNRIITQQFGRINSICNKDRALILDMVNNLGNMRYANGVNEKDGAAVVRKTVGKHKNPDISIRYLSHYRRIFNETDSVLSRNRSYTYNRFTGTLRDICFVFDADVCIAERELEKTGDICAAVRAAEKKLHGGPFSDKLGELPDFTLTDEEKVYAEKHMYLVDNFIQYRNLKDEDLIQDLYMCYLFTVHKMSHVSYDWSRNHSILTSLRQCYLVRKRAEARRERIMDKDAGVCILQQDVSGKTTRKEADNAIMALLDTLTEKEQYCLVQYYGLEYTFNDIGRRLGMTGERVRQIVNKGLRKMRNRDRREFVDVLRAHIYDKWDLEDDTDMNTFCIKTTM